MSSNGYAKKRARKRPHTYLTLRKGNTNIPFTHPHHPYWLFALAALLTLFGIRNRMKKVRTHQLPISPFAIMQATLRGHLAYTYHLCRHLTRYYTLPLLIIGLLLLAGSALSLVGMRVQCGQSSEKRKKFIRPSVGTAARISLLCRNPGTSDGVH